MAKVFSCILQKGGVSKTTTTSNLATKISESGYKVLMLDLDPQASLTISAGLEPESLEKTITDVLISFRGSKKLPITEVIIPLTENLHIVPSIIDLSVADNLLHNEMSRETVLKKSLRPVMDYYDFIFVDCPPALGLLSINALVASDYVIVPCSTEYLAYRGLNLLNQTINDVIENLNPGLKIYGVIATMHTRTTHAKEILEMLDDDFKDLLIGIVPKSVKAQDSIYSGKPIVSTDKKSKVSIAYTEIADKIIDDYKRGEI